MELTIIIITIFLLTCILLAIYDNHKKKEDMWDHIRKGDSIRIRNKSGKTCRKLISDKGNNCIRVQNFGDFSKQYFLSKFDGEFLNL